MTQLIIEAGADTLEPLVTASVQLVGDAPARIDVLPVASTYSLEYVHHAAGLKSATKRLEEGSISSLRIVPAVEGISWILLFRPNFNHEGVAWWSLVAEYRGRASDAVFESVRGIPGLKFVSLSIEEGLDFDTDVLNASTFPW